MSKYHKIPALWARESTPPHSLIPGRFQSTEVELLQDILWHWTEKVDGTNVRVIWDGISPIYHGRTDAAQLPADLASHLEGVFPEAMMEQEFGETPVVLYGEGYGAKIQKGGGLYRPDQGFILFDVRIGNLWLTQDAVTDIAEKFGCPRVPIMGEFSLRDMIHIMSGGNNLGSALRQTGPEGYVGRPFGDLRDRRGNRIIVKLINGEV
jgi:hypothetical protein